MIDVRRDTMAMEHRFNSHGDAIAMIHRVICGQQPWSQSENVYPSAVQYQRVSQPTASWDIPWPSVPCARKSGI